MPVRWCEDQKSQLRRAEIEPNKRDLAGTFVNAEPHTNVFRILARSDRSTSDVELLHVFAQILRDVRNEAMDRRLGDAVPHRRIERAADDSQRRLVASHEVQLGFRCRERIHLQFGFHDWKQLRTLRGRPFDRDARDS